MPFPAKVKLCTESLQAPSPSRLWRATARVAAPSVCFAAARILLAAAPTAPPCFRRWRRSSPLLPKGEALAVRSASSSIGNFSAPPEAPLPGELSSECETERLDEGTAYRCAAALRFSFILCRTTSRQARCTSAVKIQLTG